MQLLLLFSISLLFRFVKSNGITDRESLKTCSVQPLSINSTSPPFTVVALDSNNLEGQPLSRIASNTSDSNLNWTVDVPAGQNITFGVRDATGTVGYSESIPVIAGDSDSCIPPANATSTLSDVPQTEETASPTSSASFDPQSISSLIDSLTNFKPPPVQTLTPEATLLGGNDENNKSEKTATNYDAASKLVSAPEATQSKFSDNVQISTSDLSQSFGSTSVLLSSILLIVITFAT